MPAQPQTDKVGTGIGKERNGKGQQNEIPAIGTHQDTDQGTEQKGDQEASQCTQAHQLDGDLYMVHHDL